LLERMRFRRKARVQALSTAKEIQLAAGNAGSAPPKATTSALDETIAGGIARAGSQGTIHPLDTVKVRMQAGSDIPDYFGRTRQLSIRGQCQVHAKKFASLYRGVFGAASGAGIAIGAYFALYSWTKKVVRKIDPNRGSGSVAFVSGAIAGAGSCVVKVPIAVCIRSVQAKVFPNVLVAARSITKKAGPRGLFTGFLPTVFEDVPDMAVKFAVYETLRTIHGRVFDRRTNTQEDLLIGGIAGATSAAATTPWDVVKTRMMCSASTRPSVRAAIGQIMASKHPVKGFFLGVGPRSISSGIHTAIFFCFYEAILRAATQTREQQIVNSAAAE